MQHLWESTYVGDERACDIHISNLRRKLERVPDDRSGSSPYAGSATSSFPCEHFHRHRLDRAEKHRGTLSRCAREFTLTSAYLGGDVHVVTVCGELDVATVPGLGEELARALNEGAHEVVVDLLAVPFVDSVALGLLVETSRRMDARGGVFRIVCDDRRIARIIEIDRPGPRPALPFHAP